MFNVGDIVRCVEMDDFGCLEIGKVYRVLKVWPKTHCNVNALKYENYNISMKRFVLVDPKDFHPLERAIYGL